MPLSSAHTAVSSLRTAYRHLWHGAGMGTSAALGMLPLLYILPMPPWQRVALAGLCLLYLGSKGYRLHTGWQAVRQLRLEGCFIGHSFEDHQLRGCLQRRGHLWTHSYTVRALRRLMERPLPTLLLPDDNKRERVQQEYLHALAPVCPWSLRLELPLSVLLGGGLFAVLASNVGTLAAGPLWAGGATALLMLGAEGFQARCHYRARRAFGQLTRALAEWTLARSVHDVLRPSQPAYRHRPLYRAPAWFASPAPGRRPAGRVAKSTAPERRVA